MVSLNPLHTLEKQLYEVFHSTAGCVGKRLVAKFLTALSRRYPPGGKTADRLSASALRGERQRVMIAMALLTRPELLLPMNQPPHWTSLSRRRFYSCARAARRAEYGHAVYYS